MPDPESNPEGVSAAPDCQLPALATPRTDRQPAAHQPIPTTADADELDGEGRAECPPTRQALGAE